jgi:hypothetical protein
MSNVELVVLNFRDEEGGRGRYMEAGKQFQRRVFKSAKERMSLLCPVNKKKCK